MDFQRTLERAQTGDGAAIDALLAPFLPAVNAFVRLKLNDRVARRESSGDLVQSICRDAIRGLGSVRAADEAGFRSWLFGVVNHKLHNKHAFHRAAKRDVTRDERGALDSPVAEEALLRTYAREATPSQDAATTEEIERIECAIDRLPEAYREVILHVGIAGLSYREAGRLLEKGEDSVRQLIHRARARLATLLD